MTEQYGQRTINREGFRFVTQADLVTLTGFATATGVLLGPDDQYVFLGTNGGAAYDVYLPNVQDCAGAQFTFKHVVGGPGVTLRSLAGQTVSGGGTTIAMAAGDGVIINGDPPTPPVAPAILSTPPTNWSTITVGAP